MNILGYIFIGFVLVAIINMWGYVFRERHPQENHHFPRKD